MCILNDGLKGAQNECRGEVHVSNIEPEWGLLSLGQSTVIWGSDDILKQIALLIIITATNIVDINIHADKLITA